MNAPFWVKVWLTIPVIGAVGFFGFFMSATSDKEWCHTAFELFAAILIGWLCVTGAVFGVIGIWFPQG